MDLGVQFVQGEVVSFNKVIPLDNRPIVYDHILQGVHVRVQCIPKLAHKLRTITIESFFQVEVSPGDVRELKSRFFINCAGAAAGKIAEMADIGTNRAIIGPNLPVEPRYRSAKARI